MTTRKAWIYGLHLIGDDRNIRYGGKTVSRRGVSFRVYHHKYDAINKFRGYPSQRWILKHGPENVTYTILEETTEEFVNDREIYWIEYLKSQGQADLNILPGGEGVPSEEITGEKNPKAILTWEAVKDVRKRAEEGYLPLIKESQKLGISPGALSKVLMNDTWYDPEFDPSKVVKIKDVNDDPETQSPTWRRFNVDQIEAMREDYILGMTRKDIAKKYSTAPTTVIRVLFEMYGSEESREKCVEIRKARPQGKLHEKKWDEILQRVSKGETKASLAKEFKISASTITRRQELRAKLYL